jgi:para-aminobenzoate synthetase
MGIQDLNRPRWGVQFHPESISTDYGRAILANFLTCVDTHYGRKNVRQNVDVGKSKLERKLYWEHLGPAQDPIGLMEAQGMINGRRPTLLESSLVQAERSRFSIVEVPDAQDHSVVYDVKTSTLREFEGKACIATRQESIFEFINNTIETMSFPNGEPPFDFRGGQIGWFGYELKTELLEVSSWPSQTPDAAFRRVTQFFVIDHEIDALYAATSVSADTVETHAQRVLAGMSGLAQKAALINPQHPNPVQTAPVDFVMRHAPDDYLRRIVDCQSEIKAGESYELCLTNMISSDA